MKKLLMLAAAFALFACNSSEEMEEPQNPEMVKVNVKLAGDVITTSTTPLSRATINKETTYYGVYISSAESGFEYEATGVFDSPDNISVDLVAGHKYKFECFTVKGIDSLHPWFSKNYNDTYSTNDIGKFVDGRYFIYSYYSKNEKDFDASYGESTCTVTASSVENVEIDLKRVTMGVNLVINPPSEGKVEVTIFNETQYGEGGYCIFDKLTVASTDMAFKDEYRLLTYYQTAWEAATQTYFKFWNDKTQKYEIYDDYINKLEIYITWIHENFSKDTYPTQYVTIKRNTMTNISISVDSGSSGGTEEGTNKVVVNEDVPMSAGNTNAIVLSGSEISNTITPGE